MKYSLIMLALLLPVLSYAHGGGLNKKGCHTNSQTGKYHCHKQQSNVPSESSYHYGKVIHVTDGDTIKVRVDGNVLKVRLAEIDAPEKNQPYGMKAKQYLGNLVFGKEVRIKEVEWDRYGRMVGRVYLDKIDVNSEMVRNGFAWVYLKHLKDRSLLKDESEARRGSRGLWAGSDPVAPWEWRRGKR